MREDSTDVEAGKGRRAMGSWIQRYADWLHTGWPAGTVEALPDVRDDGSTNIPGLYVAGDLTGIPLLKFAADSGTRAVRTLLADPSFSRRIPTDGVVDLVIIGAGVAGMAAALEARKHHLSTVLLEASTAFSTIENFPRGKPIYAYPGAMKPAGALQFDPRADTRESLLDSLRRDTTDRGLVPHPGRAESVRRRGALLEVAVAGTDPRIAHRVLVAIGRSGSFRRLDVPGEDRDKVSNRLHDPAAFAGQSVLVVGGGDSALETAAALAEHGAETTVSYRREVFSRPKPETLARVQNLVADPAGRGSLSLEMPTTVAAIGEQDITLRAGDGAKKTIPNQAVFVLLGREPPLDFFRRSGVPVRGEWSRRSLISLLLVLAFCTLLYHWKADGILFGAWYKAQGWFPYNLPIPWPPGTVAGVLAEAARSPGFFYSLAYCLCVIGFGVRRIRRRRTPYVTRQTLTLMAVQVVPLFLLPYLVLPWLGAVGVFDHGLGLWFAHTFFPDQSYWRAFGFILAWPLFLWNVLTDEPLWGWLILSLVQTFVLIPLLVRRWGKGAYCGWICSCGALAETLGDTHRHKMPHGPRWNRLNLLGQGLLGFTLLLLMARIATWMVPAGASGERATFVLYSIPLGAYSYGVDLWLAGILGVGLYFHFSGRMWCRFGCPLAALMHIVARFSQFRILADKTKCISCSLCTSVCHQGIDVMAFANRGRPMADPECVRCSACVQTCPTGVLQFGRIDPATGRILGADTLAASPVRMREANGESAEAG